MTPSFPLYSILLGALAFAARAHAQDTPARTEDPGAQPQVVKIKARTNPGDLAYGWVFNNQKLLQAILPAQDRMVDFSYRITFTELGVADQDAWAPQGWAVALVANGFEQNIPVERGGYFLLPGLPQGRRGATIMFREQSLPGHIGAAWRLRVGADRHLPYAGFRQAMDEIRNAQNAIPVGHEGLKLVRTARYDALKACFLAGGGTVLVDGVPAADAAVGSCVVLKYDPALAASGKTIEFKGPLDRVTVVESINYRTGRDMPALAGAQGEALARDIEAAPDIATRAAPTNLPDLSYGWNFRRQLRAHGGVTGQASLVNFVWRMSPAGLSEAEQDAWMPQGWALALAGKDFMRAVPVARGGYFLLPALPAGRQEATLVFKELGKRNVVGPAWVVRLREGPRPFLHYGEIQDAMDAVRKVQDEIPEGRAELAELRAGRYDGLKACFLESDAVVFVGNMPTADATVGNCKILKFDPKQNANEKIEFVGKVDAVTVVDTAPYLRAKI